LRIWLTVAAKGKLPIVPKLPATSLAIVASSKPICLVLALMFGCRVSGTKNNEEIVPGQIAA
jgi:hypothetical protein